MKKREVKKILKEYLVYKSNRRDFDYQVGDHYIKFVNTNKNTQLTINSPGIYQIHTGKVDGIRFIRKSSTITRFNKTDKVYLLLLSTPFKILKYINENEIVDISDSASAHNMTFIRTTEELESILKEVI